MPEVNTKQSRSMVLVVDDEKVVLRLASAVLSEAGYATVVAESAADGLECYHKHREEISLVLVDVVMPGGSGLEMALRIRELDPAAKILVMSGYSDASLEVQARTRVPFIRKPFLRGDLLGKVEEVLAGCTGR